MIVNNSLVFKNALKEVDYIIGMFPLAIQKRIPNNVKKDIAENMNNDYIPNLFDINKPIEEQNILEETKLILASIYKDYIVSDEERKKLIMEENHIRQQLEEKKKEKYNPDNLFKSMNKQKSLDKKENIQDISIANNNKTSFVHKIYNKIIHLFK